MASTLDRIFLRPMTSAYVTINRLSTMDTSPPLSGRYRPLNGNPPTSITVTIDGNDYPASSFAGGVWQLDDNEITPALTAGLYEVSVEAVFPGPISKFDFSHVEVSVVDAFSYRPGDGGDYAYGSPDGTAYKYV